MASKLDSRTFSCFRNCENVEVPLAVASGDLRSSLHEAGEGGEELADVTGMFEAVIIMLPSLSYRTTSASRSAASTLLTRGTLLPTVRAISPGVSRPLKKAHLLRSARSPRSNVSANTPPLAGFSRASRLNLFEQPGIRVFQQPVKD